MSIHSYVHPHYDKLRICTVTLIWACLKKGYPLVICHIAIENGPLDSSWVHENSMVDLSQQFSVNVYKRVDITSPIIPIEIHCKSPFSIDKSTINSHFTKIHCLIHQGSWFSGIPAKYRSYRDSWPIIGSIGSTWLQWETNNTLS